jgi:hypothetical protein
VKINATHPWKSVRKRRKETKELPLASYPLGNTNQFTKPVPHKIINRIKEITLTIQSLEDFPLDICFENPVLSSKKHIEK